MVLLAGVIITTLVLIGLVSINVLVGQSGVGADDLAKTIAQKQQQADMLQVDVLRLSAPARIRQRAEQLGMVPATDVTYLAPLPARAPAPTSSAARTRGGR